jgi:hypothetical protein
MGKHTFGFAVAAAMIVALPLHAQEVTVRARVDSTNYGLGDPIRVHVDFSHPKGIRLQPLTGDTVGSFQVLDRTPLKAESETKTSTDYVVARYEAGDATLPGLDFLYSAPGDTSTHKVSTNPLVLKITALPVDTTKDIKDLKPPLRIPLSLAEIALYLGIVVAVVVVGYFLYRYWKRRKRKKDGDVYVPPPRPAHIIALEELAKLKEKKLWQQGRIKEYYSEVTEILRRYIENRYRLMAMEETTDEIMAGLATLHLSKGVLDETGAILRRADLVKFAKYLPGIPEHEDTLKIVYDVVDKTKVLVMTPVAPEEAKAVSHAGK